MAEPERPAGQDQNTNPGMERLTRTVEEAAAILGISRPSAYEAAKQGKIPTIKIGRRILVPLAALNKMLAAAGQGAL